MEEKGKQKFERKRMNNCLQLYLNVLLFLFSLFCTGTAYLRDENGLLDLETRLPTRNSDLRYEFKIRHEPVPK